MNLRLLGVSHPQHQTASYTSENTWLKASTYTATLGGGTGKAGTLQTKKEKVEVRHNPGL